MADGPGRSSRSSRRPPSDAEFTEFMHATWAALYRTAYLLVGDHGLAEDLAQTALTRTYANWSRVRRLEAAPGYARTAVVNAALSMFRKRSWRQERPSAELPERPGTEVDPSLRPDLLAALAVLPARQRAVVVLRFYDDLSVAETAAALGCAEGTVKSQTSDALARLRTLLGESVIPESRGASHD
ncbi:MAG: SigE family RNA polymerase sigma factor [Nocardioides sp.]